MNVRKKLFLAVALLAAAALVVYTVLFERYWIAYHEVPVRVPGLPAAFDGFRIQVIADLHAGYLMPPWWVRHVLDAANARPKDMIALVGIMCMDAICARSWIVSIPCLVSFPLQPASMPLTGIMITGRMQRMRGRFWTAAGA
jgi:hypothetical protein